MNHLLQNIRRDTRLALLTALLSGAGATAVVAQTTATLVVQFDLQPIAMVSLNPSSTPMVIEHTFPVGPVRPTGAIGPVAETGAASPVVVAGWQGTLGITNNQENRKITASLDEDVPTGLAAYVRIRAVGADPEALYPAIGMSPVDIMTGIGSASGTAFALEAYVSSDKRTGAVRSDRVLLFTIVAAA